MKATIRAPAMFSAASRRVEGGYAIYPDAMLFEVGSFPDKNFALTHADMDAAIAGFSPEEFRGSIEHTPFLKGRAFTVRSIRRDATDPGRLRGEVAVPLGLDAILDDAERGFSAEWDRATKRLVGGALTVNPRIKGASLVATFAAGAAGSTDDPAILRETISALAAFCACQAETNPDPEPTEETPMAETTQDRLARALALVEEMDEDTLAVMLGEVDPDDDEVPVEPLIDTTNFSADDAEKAELRQRLEAMEEKDRRKEAALFAKDEVRAERITPHEEANAASVMYRAMADDAIVGDTVNFSQSGKPVSGTREQMVRAAYGQRTPHRLGAQQIASFAHALPNGGTTPETDEEYAARVVAKYNGRNKIANGTA